MGTEFNQETAGYARDRFGLRVIAGEAFEALAANQFDLITIIHVLEHLPNPGEMIARCRRVLKNGGRLVIAVPNFASMQAVVGKDKWFHLDLPYHLTHFSDAGLDGLLGRHGFRVARRRHFDLEQNVFGWLQTLLNLCGLRRNALYDLLKQAPLRGEVGRLGPGSVTATLVLLPLLAPTSLLLAFVESILLRRGGTIELEAVSGP